MRKPAAINAMLIAMMIGLAACSGDVMGPEPIEHEHTQPPELVIGSKDAEETRDALDAPEKPSEPVEGAVECEPQGLSQVCVKGVD